MDNILEIKIQFLNEHNVNLSDFNNDGNGWKLYSEFLEKYILKKIEHHEKKQREKSKNSIK